MTIPIESFEPRTLARDWGTETVVAESLGLVGKILVYLQGRAGGLQAHTRRREHFHLFQGEAWVDSDDGAGRLVRHHMTAGQTFHIPPGAPHRFEAITDCIVFEISDSAAPDRVRLEAIYGEAETGGLPTTWPPGEWVPSVPDPGRYRP